MRRNAESVRARRSRRVLVPGLVLGLAISASVLLNPTTPRAQAAEAADPVCTISAKLVNSCRPWVGAESGGYGVGSNFRTRMQEHETRSGRPMDIVHAYTGPNDVLGTDISYMAKRANTIAMVNYKPAYRWAAANGQDAAVNTQIDKMANSIKALGSAKIMLTIYHEPESSISAGGSPSCPALLLEGTSGSTADYVDMWHNVRQRFDALGVSNVVWVMNYVGYVTRQCVTKDLWPGNNYVDWVMWDPYPKNASWTATVGSFYNYLTANSDAEHDFLSKAWGLAEYGYVGSNQNAAYTMYDEARRNLQNGVHPRLKAFIVWDNYTSNSHDDRVGFAETHVADPIEQQHYNAFVNDPLLMGTAVPEPTDQTPPTVVRTTPEDGATVEGEVSITGTATDDKGIEIVELLLDGEVIDSATPGADGAVSFDWNSATVVNGSHILRLRARDAASNTGQSEAATVTVENIDDEAPSAPTDVDATWSRTSQVTVTWSEATDNAAVTGYRVYRDGDLIGSPGAAARSFNDTTVSNLVTHTYTVTAVDAADHESEPSNEAVVDTGDDTPPTAPTTVDATLTGPDQATVTWSGASDNGGVVGYRVYRNGTLRADVTDGSGTLVDDGLDDATTYTYRVAAYDAHENVSPLSDPASVTTEDATAPTVPQNLRAVSSPQSVALAWNASTDNVGVTNYVVYRDGLPQVTLTNGATSWTDSAPDGNTLHRYQVTAGDAKGNESEKSSEVARTVDATAPSTPLNLRAVSAPQSVALAWNASTDNVGVTSYVVYRDGLPRATLAGTATSWTDSALNGSTLHRYQVTAGDASGNESAKSNEVARTIDTTAPSVPLNVRAVSTASTVALTWSASTDNVGVTNYIVYRDGVARTTLGGTTTSWTDTALTGSTLHRYQVTARDATGNESAKSAQVSRTLTDTTAPTAPTRLARTLSGFTVRLTWTASTDNVGVVGYTIYRGGVAIGTSTTPAYSDAAAPLGRTSSYTVRARDAAGNLSAASTALSVAVPADTTAPTTPGGLKATAGAAGSRQITVAWNASSDNVGVTSYYLFRANAKYKLLGKVTSYVDTGLTAGTRYTYKVYALDAAGNWSGASGNITATAR